MGRFIHFVVALVLFASSTLAGPVTYGTGSIVVTYSGTDVGDDTKSFDVTAPGAKTESYDGAYDIGGSGFIVTRGHSGATYDIKDRSDGADLDVSIFHSNKGGDGGTLGGTVDFALAFTLDRPLHYAFHIDPAGATHFEASLDQTHEFLDIDVFGTTSGSLITDGVPTAKTLEGTLPAGSHVTTISLIVSNGRSQGGGSTDGSFTLALSDGGGGTPIPLPLAVWSGLLTLASVAVASNVRLLKRRA